eukprot:COSAG02_NODE_808_length_16924_cov_117.299733_14_plen_93_part_00
MRLNIHAQARDASLVLIDPVALRRYLMINPPDRVELYENRVVVRLKVGSKFLVGGCFQDQCMPIVETASCALSPLDLLITIMSSAFVLTRSR